MQWRCRERTLDLSRPVVMGILNVTPDSFSDGGRYAQVEAALERAARLVAEGACIIDIGGESTRPGATAVDEATELARVIPVIEALAARSDVAISIDTYKPGVMRAATDAGAVIVNDIRALQLPGAREFAARSGVGVCLMHMRGEPATMQQRPYYNDAVGEVREFLARERAQCIAAGVREASIALDPGLGFGKGLQHNLELLRELKQFASLGAPLLVGVSRKSFIGRMIGREPDERLYGGLGLAAWAVAQGASIIRTHDVAVTRDAIGAVAAVMKGVA